MIRDAAWWHRLLDLAFRAVMLIAELIGFVLIIWIVLPLAGIGWIIEKSERRT